MSTNLKSLEVWFVTGSQHLYGPETLKAVAKHSQEIAKRSMTRPPFPSRSSSSR
jgi:L-arabinose isomerase